MRAVIVYESMFGNARKVAEAIGEGLSSNVNANANAEVEVVNVNSDAIGAVAGADLVIVGAPTHAHSLSTPSSRKEAAEWAADPERDLDLEPGADGIGVREWLSHQPDLPRLYAAFDTRADMIRLFTGAASAPIGRKLAERRLQAIVPAESFAVSMHNQLAAGELDRAREWGARIAEVAAARQIGSQTG